MVQERSNKELKMEVLDETQQLFNEIYCGIKCPPIDEKKVKYFVEKALNRFETKLNQAHKFKRNII